jgi:hypothetical protein
MVLWYMLLSEEMRVWEQRLGYWGARCQTCHRDCWQLTYRIWRTQGNGLSPATPWNYPHYGEAYQVRCASCGIGAMVGHPNTWIPQLGSAFVHEQHHPTPATPHYLNIAFPVMR